MSHTKAEWLKALEISARVNGAGCDRIRLFEEAGKILDMIDDVIEGASAPADEEPRLPPGWEFREDPSDFLVGFVSVYRVGDPDLDADVYIGHRTGKIFNHAGASEEELAKIEPALHAEIARREAKERC